VEWSYDTDGRRIKTTRRAREVRKTTRVLKKVLERRKWAKFGVPRGVVGPETGITSLGESVRLDLTPQIYQKKAEKEDKLGLQLEKTAGTGTTNSVSCRYCKGDHFTVKCPLKDTLGRGQDTAPSAPAPSQFERDTPGDRAVASAGGAPGKYIPPNLRDGIGGRKSVDQARLARQELEDLCALRVTNLSEEADDEDLRALFCPFGAIQRIYLVRERDSDRSRGFAFVHFFNRDDAQRAKEKLHDRPYGHQILDVDWAKPRTN